MTRLILTFLLLVTVIAGAVAQNDAIYVYRNDGKFEAFFKSEIDSMSYSHYDVDSVYHNEWQAQIVYTADSIYYIPLEVIDSISFTAPETKYSHDVVKLDKLIPYLKNVSGMVLNFNNTLPTDIKPQIGDVLLYEGYDNPMFEQGFAGRVSSVDNYDVICDSVSLSEVYEQLISFGEYQAVEEPEPNSGVMRMRLVPKRVAGHVASSIALKGTVGTDTLYLSLDGTLKFDLRIVSKITAYESPYIDLSFTPSFSATLQGGIKGNIKGKWLENMVKVFGLPIPETPFYVYIKSGPALDLNLDASITLSTGVDFGFKMGLRYENNNWFPYGYNVSKGFSTPELTGNINGSIFMGIGTEVGISSYGDLIKFFIKKKLGVELSANFTTNLLESNKYEELSKAKLDLDFVGGISANALLKFTPLIQLEGSFNIFSARVGILTWKLVPSFSIPEITDTKSTSAKITVTPKEDLRIPVSIGIGLFDNDNNLTECAYLSPNYRLEKNSKEVDYSYVFTNLESNKKYIACPMVKWLGIDLTATPQQDFTLDDINVSITSFKVTDSEYKQGAFMNDGLYYDYKFNVSLTVEIDDLDGVEDWGYVYRDPYGNVKRISLMEYGQSYTDTRYAYYRNEAHSTACLYTYVKYVYDPEYYDSEPHDYPLDHGGFISCPDDNHPHAIDLGLPSGTKWACCNVGASSPEEYGGYYAWGETSEKSVYNRDNYTYYDHGYINIGSNISGTQYDVAHVCMGDPWRMPTIGQHEELVKRCTKVWTQQNGVNGILVTGPSGGQIFFPAAGYRSDGNLFSAGTGGIYWSSDHRTYGTFSAYFFDFGPGYWNWQHNSYLYDGHSVRSVCPREQGTDTVNE